MILLGHPLIESKPFYRINLITSISKTPAQATVFFEFNPNFAQYCTTQNISFAMHVKHIKELVLAHALGASYFVVDKALAAHAQKIANDYLYDGKIILLSNDDADIEFAASHGIDGILFEAGIQTL